MQATKKMLTACSALAWTSLLKPRTICNSFDSNAFVSIFSYSHSSLFELQIQSTILHEYQLGELFFLPFFYSTFILHCKNEDKNKNKILFCCKKTWSFVVICKSEFALWIELHQQNYCEGKKTENKNVCVDKLRWSIECKCNWKLKRNNNLRWRFTLSGKT